MKDHLKALTDRYLDPVAHYERTGETLFAFNIAWRCEVIPVPDLRKVRGDEIIGGIVYVISGEDTNGNPCEILYTVSAEDVEAMIEQQTRALVALRDFQKDKSWKLS